MKKLLIIIAISVLAAVGAAVAVYFGIRCESYEMNIYEKVAAYFLLPLWAFSVVPAYALELEWLSNKSFMFAFWYGYVFGLFLPLLIAPALMVFYFVGTIEKLIKKDRL